MNPDTLCMGCMSERGVAEECARCHYRYGTPAETPLVLQPGTTLNSHYLVGKKLGQGGFGITYIGYGFATSRRLAIKEYFPREISTRAEDRHTVSPISRANRKDLDYGLLKFEEEARALAQFKDHPGIVSFLDFFKANGTAYLVMGYVEGDTLRKHLLERGEKIPFDEALKILSQVMEALEDVHRVHILHRDISPENIYIERDGNVKLLDFGAAKQAFGEQSQSLSVILRPGYAPPEQYHTRGRQGPWTDIYALGATLYRSITGKVPSESLSRLERDDLVRPRQLGVIMPSRSETALLKAMALKVENRFQTAGEFRTAITPRDAIGKVEGRIEQAAAPKQLSKPLLLSFLIIIFTTMFALNVAGKVYVAVEIYPMMGLFALMLFIFHRMWKSIQDGHARTAPDKAVTFCFIPVFNLYWAFPVMWGFSVDYNRYLNRHQPDLRKLPEGLFLAATIVYVVTCITAPFSRDFFSFLIVVNAILLCIVVARTCDAINALGLPSPGKPLPAPPPTDRTAAGQTAPERVPYAKVFSLYCLAGQYEGQHVEISQQAIIIGRNPARSNLVLSSDDISAAHVKVWRDASDGGVWIEDLKSTNGTFYRKAASDSSTGWIQLSGSKLLAPGDLFQLSQGTALFEVRQPGTRQGQK